MQKLLQDMVETNGDRIYRLALRYTGDRDQAEDLVQETFLRAYKHLDSYDQSKPAGPWLFKIATNIFRNWLRDNREVSLDLTGRPGQASNPGPEELFLEKERSTELSRAIAELPLIYREVLLLKHVGEISYAEISATLGIELTLVKNRLYRGRIMLKNILTEGGWFNDRA